MDPAYPGTGRSPPMSSQQQPTQAQAMPAPVIVSAPAASTALSPTPPKAGAALVGPLSAAAAATLSPSALLRDPGTSASSVAAPTGVDLEIRGAIKPFKQEQLIEVFKAGTRFKVGTRSSRSGALMRCYISEFHAQGGVLVEVPGKQAIAFLDTTSNCVGLEGQKVPRPRSVTFKWAKPGRTIDTGLLEEPFAIATEQLDAPGRITLRLLNKDHSPGPELLQVLQYTTGSICVSDPDSKLVATLKPDPRPEGEGMPSADSWSLLTVSNLYSSYGGDVGLVLCAVIAACKMQA